MNIARGVFRLWVVLTCLWFAMGIALVWNSATLRQVLKLDGVLVPLAGQLIEVDHGATDGDLDEVFDAFPWNRFAKFDPSWVAKHEAERAAFKRDYKASVQSIPSRAVGLIWSAAIFASVPFLLLAFIKIAAWIGRGFLSN